MGPVSRVDFVLWRPDMRLAKKKNVVSRAQKVHWRPVSRVDFVLWRPDMRLAKKKCGLQSTKSTLETSLQSRFCALETRNEISKKKMWSPEHKKYPGDQSPE